MEYAQMERDGKTLEEIAEAGFVWSDYLGDTNSLDAANMLVKVALADESKMGDLVSIEGLGEALVNILCDLLNDLATAPVTTIVSKLSDPNNITPILDFALGLPFVQGPDADYKSYDMFFTDIIRTDKDENPYFYDAIVQYNRR